LPGRLVCKQSIELDIKVSYKSTHTDGTFSRAGHVRDRPVDAYRHPAGPELRTAL